jgi:hypothetical protein
MILLCAQHLVLLSQQLKSEFYVARVVQSTTCAIRYCTCYLCLQHVPPVSPARSIRVITCTGSRSVRLIAVEMAFGKTSAIPRYRRTKNLTIEVATKDPMTSKPFCAVCNFFKILGGIILMEWYQQSKNSPKTFNFSKKHGELKD